MLDIVFVIVLIICFFTDLKKQMIYNKVIIPSFVASLIMNFYSYGYKGLILSLLGLLTGLIILIVPYVLGGMGAGDVKLLAIIGSFKGIMFTLNTALYMALIGGLIAFFIILINKQTFNFFSTFFKWMYSLFIGIKYKLEFPNSVLSIKYPYGTAIVMGALICLFFKGAWII